MAIRTGVEEMSVEEYLKAPGINQSGLKRLARSPAHYREYVKNPPAPTPDQKLGTVCHYGVFQPHLFGTSHYVKPSMYVSEDDVEKKWNGNSNICKTWLKEHSDRLVLTGEDRGRVEGMCKSVFNHPAAALALAEGQPELSLFCEDPETGLQLKCRTDWLSGNGCVDLKKCQDASKLGFRRTINNYWYDLQAAFTLHVARILSLQKDIFAFIAVEDVPPFAVGVYQIDDVGLETGKSKMQRLLIRYLECVTTGQWPAYSRNIEFISLPTYANTEERLVALDYYEPGLPALTVE